MSWPHCWWLEEETTLRSASPPKSSHSTTLVNEENPKAIVEVDKFADITDHLSDTLGNISQNDDVESGEDKMTLIISNDSGDVFRETITPGETARGASGSVL